MPKAMIISVGTGRDRQDIAGAILFSIKQNNPEYIRFLVSSVSGKETLPLITKDLVVPYNPHQYDEINDVEKIYFEYVEQIKDCVNRGFKLADIVADYTSGTKSMSAALLLAAISTGVGTVSYIYGERDHGGRAVPGTERSMYLNPNRFYAEKTLLEAKKLFNINRFESCINLCKSVEETIKLPIIVEETSFLINLSRTYDAWDRFDFTKALEYFNAIKESPLLKKYEIKSKVEKHKAFVYQEKENKYCYERVIDIVANAKRRFNEEGRYDDGLARLYRGFEYLSQVKLYLDHDGLETENLKSVKLPERLKTKYSKKTNDSGKIQISLVCGYELLQDLGDTVGQNFMEDKSNQDFKLVLRKRNDSILAHGFIPIDKDSALKLLTYLEKHITRCYPDYESKKGLATFPKLKF
ncbi:MAG: TIGR02710 family CRISPR-associated protein [Nitrospirae bacterium]|nr:TIGR02710 family CRISPR-associated protein [Nitrospirota bacterium]